MKKVILHLLFLGIVVGDFIGILYHNQQLNYIFKPLIMVWISGYFFFYSKVVEKKVVQFTFLAFLFSWVGDILLMFGNDFIYFVSGLSAFLVAQIMYINLFLRTINLSGKKPYLKKRPFWLIAYIAYGMSIYILLFDNLDGVLKIAVFVYMVALLGMSVMALNRYGNGHPVSFSLVFAGSVFFVLSDSLIAIDKFLVEIPHQGIYIMGTYIVAQYLIMRGLLKQYE